MSELTTVLILAGRGDFYCIAGCCIYMPLSAVQCNEKKKMFAKKKWHLLYIFVYLSVELFYIVIYMMNHDGLH